LVPQPFCSATFCIVSADGWNTGSKVVGCGMFAPHDSRLRHAARDMGTYVGCQAEELHVTCHDGKSRIPVNLARRIAVLL
jgi:hypothetical protein